MDGSYEASVKRDLANWESVSHTFVVYYVNMAGGYVFVIILCIVIFASTSSYTVSSSQFKRGRGNLHTSFSRSETRSKLFKVNRVISRFARFETTNSFNVFLGDVSSFQ